VSNERKGVNLRAPHEASEIIGYAYRLYVRHFRAMFLIGLTTVPLSMLGAVVQDRVGSEYGSLAALPIELGGALVTVIATGALIFAVNDVAGGQPADFNRSLDAGFERFSALFTTNLLSGILTFLSIGAIPYFLVRGRFDAACSVPYFAVRWNLSPQAVMIEGKQNWSALDASALIVRGRWWRTLGVLLLILLVALVPVFGFSAATVLPTIAATTIVSIGLALVLPFLVGAQTLLYYDLRARAMLAAAAGQPLPTLEPTDDAAPTEDESDRPPDQRDQ
jgi:hypothetical protein